MRLNQVTLPSLNIERSIKFYEILGLKLIVKALPHYARFECPEGGSTFSIHVVERISRNSEIMIYFETEKLDERVDQLKLKGIKFDQNPENKSWLWREARLRDPDGNQLVLYFAGENRLNPPWRL
ncbi:MAG: VOC family protein [Nonlabens sp.]